MIPFLLDPVFVVFHSKCTNASLCRHLVTMLMPAVEESAGVKETAPVYTTDRFELDSSFPWWRGGDKSSFPKAF